MKLSINKVMLCLLMCAVVGGCSSKTETEKQAAPAVEETVIVEEQVLPQQETPVADKPASVQKNATKSIYPTEMLINVKAWDKKLKFLKTSFTQTTTYDGVPVSSSKGFLYYDKDKNLLRLDTDDGDGKIDQSAITDKKQILILDGQGREITTLSWQEWQQGQPNQALFDFGNYTALLARHHVTAKEPFILELTPKEGDPYTLYLTLSKEDYFPVNIKIVSDLMVTEAALDHTQKNEPLAFDTFRAGGLFK